MLFIPPVPSDSSGSSGTLSGQTSSSDPMSEPSSSVECAVATTILTGNGGDKDDDDEYTDDDDEDDKGTVDYDEHETTMNVQTNFVFESDSSHKAKIKRKKRDRESTSAVTGRVGSSGDTGSSSCGLRPILPIAQNVGSLINVKRDEQTLDSLSILADSLRKQMEKESMATIEESRVRM